MTKDEQKSGSGNGGKAGVDAGDSATQGPSEKKPEAAGAGLNPSAPGETGTTPGTNQK